MEQRCEVVQTRSTSAVSKSFLLLSFHTHRLLSNDPTLCHTHRQNTFLPQFTIHKQKNFSRDPTVCHRNKQVTFLQRSDALPYTQTRDFFLNRYPVLPSTQTKDFPSTIPRFDIHIDKRILLPDTPLCHIHRQETFLSANTRYAINTDKRIFLLDPPHCHTYRQETFLALSHALPYTKTRYFSRTISRFAIHNDRVVSRAIPCFVVHTDKRCFSRDHPLRHTHRQKSFLTHGFKTYVVSLHISQKIYFLYYLLNILILFVVVSPQS